MEDLKKDCDWSSLMMVWYGEILKDWDLKSSLKIVILKETVYAIIFIILSKVTA